MGPAGIELAASASSEHLGESRRIFGWPVFPVQMRRCLPTMKRSGTAGACPPGRDCRPGTSIQRCWPKGQPVQRESQNRSAEEWAVGHRAGFSERRPSFRFGRKGVGDEINRQLPVLPIGFRQDLGGPTQEYIARHRRCVASSTARSHRATRSAICDLRDPTRAPGGARSAPLVSGTNAAGFIRPPSTAVTV